MKLLSQKEAKTTVKVQNDELIKSNVRLREYHQSIVTKLNNVKDSYEPDKLERLADFEQFCKGLQEKKDKALGELNAIQKLVKEQKDIYYGYIRKRDDLTEMQVMIDEENKKLNLRQVFIEDLEAKWREKQ